MDKKIIVVFILTSTVLSVSVFLLCVVNSDVFNIVDNSISDGGTVTLKVQKHKAFDLYLKKFNKSYAPGEYEKRLPYFMSSLKEISRLNTHHDNVFGLTIFSDWSREEFSRRMLMPRNVADCVQQCRTHDNDHTNLACNIPTTPLPLKFDWRDRGKIGPVLNQDHCLACWAISIAGVMESMAAIHDMGYTKLSIQQLLDCVKGRSHGCEGTEDMENALSEMFDNNMYVTTAEQYPLVLVDQQCKGRSISGRRIRTYWTDCDVDEDKILNWIVNHGPVIAIVNADPWMFYNGGIIQHACVRSHDGKSVDHAVQIVGYDKTGSVPYYIVRNSWGKNFGIDGYVKLVIYKNICGIADEVYFLDVL